jgi:hypothetical protein
VKSNLKLILFLFLTVILTTVSSISVANDASKAELETLSKIFAGDNQFQIRDSAKALSWLGISDTALFDPIEEKLLENYLITDKHSVETNAWYAKALSYSGQEKYRDTLAKISSSSAPAKLRKHSKRALKSLTKYKTWNPIISEGLNNTSDYTPNQIRMLNLLNSDNSELIRIGGKRAYWEYFSDDVVLDSAANVLENTFNDINPSDKVLIDAYAWICKALARSENSKYKLVLEKVRDNTNNSKLRKYAKKYAKAL